MVIEKYQNKSLVLIRKYMQVVTHRWLRFHGEVGLQCKNLQHVVDISKRYYNHIEDV